MLSDREIAAIDAKAQTFAQFARAIIAAYQAKLLDGVEMPEPDVYEWDEMHGVGGWSYSRERAKQIAVVAAAQARMKALDEAKGACVERMSFWRLSDDRYDEAESCAYAVEKLKGGE